MLISNVCEVALRSLFWAPSSLNELLEVCFKFPFNLIPFGILTMAFLTGHSWCIRKSWYTGGDPEQAYRCCFTDRLNQRFSFLLWHRLIGQVLLTFINLGCQHSTPSGVDNVLADQLQQRLTFISGDQAYKESGVR